jgi:hypothetical protein
MVIVTARISDAQFSIGEADRIRRAAQDVLKLRSHWYDASAAVAS